MAKEKWTCKFGHEIIGHWENTQMKYLTTNNAIANKHKNANENILYFAGINFRE